MRDYNTQRWTRRCAVLRGGAVPGEIAFWVFWGLNGTTGCIRAVGGSCMTDIEQIIYRMESCCECLAFPAENGPA
jgi:hypothetical protein